MTTDKILVRILINNDCCTKNLLNVYIIVNELCVEDANGLWALTIANKA